MRSASSIRRRSFLGMIAAAALVGVAKPALAGTRILKMVHDERGTTLHLDLQNAPFPAPGSPYKDSTVIAFVPNHFRLGRDERVPLLVHFHGHTSTAESAM